MCINSTQLIVKPASIFSLPYKLLETTSIFAINGLESVLVGLRDLWNDNSIFNDIKHAQWILCLACIPPMTPTIFHKLFNGIIREKHVLVLTCGRSHKKNLSHFIGNLTNKRVGFFKITLINELGGVISWINPSGASETSGTKSEIWPDLTLMKD